MPVCVEDSSLHLDTNRSILPIQLALRTRIQSGTQTLKSPLGPSLPNVTFVAEAYGPLQWSHPTSCMNTTQRLQFDWKLPSCLFSLEGSGQLGTLLEKAVILRDRSHFFNNLTRSTTRTDCYHGYDPKLGLFVRLCRALARSTT